MSPAAGGGGVRLDRGDKEECFFRSSPYSPYRGVLLIRGSASSGPAFSLFVVYNLSVPASSTPCTGATRTQAADGKKLLSLIKP